MADLGSYNPYQRLATTVLRRTSVKRLAIACTHSNKLWQLPTADSQSNDTQIRTKDPTDDHRSVPRDSWEPYL